MQQPEVPMPPPEKEVPQTRPRSRQRQWAKDDLPIQLPQLAASASPARRRRPEMLIIDENLQISIKELTRDWESKTLAERNLQEVFTHSKIIISE